MLYIPVSENKKKKDIPRWLKKDGSSTDEIDGVKSETGEGREDDLLGQLDEEFERFSSAGWVAE